METVAQRRRLLLDIALRRASPGTGSAEAFLRNRTAMNTWPDLSDILGDVPWAVVGAVATRAYMPERATRDLGVLVADEDAGTARCRLRAAGFEHIQELSIGAATWRSPDGTLIDVVESTAEWVHEALAVTKRDPQGLPVLSLPYLVLMKVQAGRTQDLADAARMLGLASEESRDNTRDLFRRWYPDAAEDVESLIALGELEIQDSGWRRDE